MALTNRASFVGTHLLPSDKAAAACTEEERRARLEARWAEGGLGVLLAFPDSMFDRSANEVVAEFVRSKIRATVADPAVAEALSPRGYAIGSKRLCVDTGYYATFNRPNVRLVDLRQDRRQCQRRRRRLALTPFERRAGCSSTSSFRC